MRLLGLVALWITVLCSASSVEAQQRFGYWVVREDALYPATVNLQKDGRTAQRLRGRDMIALSEAKRRISEAFGLDADLVITDRPGINAAALGTPERNVVIVHADTITALGEDTDAWAALLGHEFAHLYHNHGQGDQARKLIIGLIAAVINAHELRHGRDRTALIDFGATLIDRKFDRDQEREADATGVTYMMRAGYRPEGALRLQQQLLAHSSDSSWFEFLQTHPPGRERIENIKTQIAASNVTAGKTNVAAVSAEEVQRWIVLCSSEGKQKSLSGLDLQKAVPACLMKENREYARRYLLCSYFLQDTLDRKPEKSDYIACFASQPTVAKFSFGEWMRYCSAEAELNNVAASERNGYAFRCVAQADKNFARRGAICAAEAHAKSIPKGREFDAFVRSCSKDTTPAATRFALAHIQAGCDLEAQGATPGNPSARDSYAKSCVEEVLGGIRQPIAAGKQTPQVAPTLQTAAQDDTKAVGLMQQSTGQRGQGKQLVPSVTECDRLAYSESAPGVDRVYYGYINAPAAERSCLEAIKSNKNNARFEANLARVYTQQGHYVEALRLADSAYNKGSRQALVVIAYLNNVGLGTKLDHEKGYRALSEAADHGVVEAYGDLASMFMAGHFVQRDIQRAIELLRKGVDLGDREAASKLGVIYVSGRDVNKDVGEAVKFFRIAASDEYPSGMVGLGRALRESPGTEAAAESKATFDRAKPILKRYADLGSAVAQVRLGEVLLAERDRERAFGLFLQASEKDVPSAWFNVGMCYLTGSGVETNRDKGIEALRKAASKGHIAAREQLEKVSR